MALSSPVAFPAGFQEPDGRERKSTALSVQMRDKPEADAKLRTLARVTALRSVTGSGGNPLRAEGETGG